MKRYMYELWGYGYYMPRVIAEKTAKQLRRKGLAYNPHNTARWKRDFLREKPHKVVYRDGKGGKRAVTTRDGSPKGYTDIDDYRERRFGLEWWD